MALNKLKAICNSQKNSTKSGRVVTMNGEPARNPSDLSLEIAHAWSSSRHEELLHGIDMQRGTSDLSTLVTSALPKGRVRITQKARSWFGSDDLLFDLIDTKRTFTLSGFHLQTRPRSVNVKDIDADEMAQHQEKADEFSISTQLSKIVYDLLTDWFVSDSMILVWKVNETQTASQPDSIDSVPRKIQNAIPGLEYIGTVNPEDVDWKNSLGTNRLFVRVPRELEERIKIALNRYGNERSKAIQELINSGIPAKWIEAVIGYNGVLPNSEFDGPLVELKNEDGEYWIIKTKAKLNYGLACPSMFTIFLSLECRRMFNDGEFAAAFMLKHFIQHIKLGESITNGDNAGSTKNWAKDADCVAILDKFANTQKSMRMATNHTVKIEWLFPPPEIFNEDKYKNCEKRIFRWAGVNASIIGGGKETTAEAFVGLKRMIADMWLARTRTSEILLEFFRHPTIRSRSGIPEELDVVGQYDENVLKDPRQLLDEVKFLVQEGMGDPDTTLRELGRDPESVRLSKMRSIERNNTDKVFEPVWNSRLAGRIPQDGESGGTLGGRPPNAGTERSDVTRLQEKTNRDTAASNGSSN